MLSLVCQVLFCTTKKNVFPGLLSTHSMESLIRIPSASIASGTPARHSKVEESSQPPHIPKELSRTTEDADNHSCSPSLSPSKKDGTMLRSKLIKSGHFLNEATFLSIHSATPIAMFLKP